VHFCGHILVNLKKNRGRGTMFEGSSSLTLDGKGRMTVPARHRDIILAQAQGRLTITRSYDGCLLMYTRPAWEKIRPRIAALPTEAANYRRMLLGNAMPCDMDGTGRVLIAPELRKPLSIQREVMLLGVGGYFEIWEAGQLEAQQEELKSVSVRPVSVANFQLDPDV
jgi:MraZ protein